MPPNVIDTLQDLVGINSVNPAYEGGRSEADCASYVEAFCRDAGIETWRQEVFPGRPNLIARLPGQNSDHRVIFEAHTDTVGASEMQDAFNPILRDGHLFGRGACDTKGGLAAMMHAIAQVKSSGEIPPCEIWLAATADEEHSCRGVWKLCEQLKATAAVVAEPTQLRIATACKGCLRWKILTHGKESHSSKPDLGNNAIVQMSSVIETLNQHSQTLRNVSHRLLGPATCSIGLIRGGTQINVVPNRCEIEIDRRLLPGEEIDAVLEGYKSLLEDLKSSQPTLEYSFEEPTLADPPLYTANDAPLVQRSIDALNRMGLNSDPIGVPFSCDASKFELHGIPAIVFGPGSIDQAHTPNEFVECRQVEQSVEFYRDLMLSDLTQ